MAVSLLAGLGRVISGVASNKAVRGAVTGAADKLKDNLLNRNKNQEVIPAKVSVVGGMTNAVRSTAGAAGGGAGGALVTTGGGGVNRSSSAIVKSGGKDILSKFDVLINAFKRLIEIEKENQKLLEQQILDFARGSEKESRSAEQSGQEKSKPKSEKNPIIESGKKAFNGIFGFISDLVGAFIKYKILEWISKPENTEAIKNTIQFFMNVGKLLGVIGKFVVGPIFNIVKELATGGLKVFGEVIESVINVFSLKWLTNPLGFIKDILDVPKTLVETTFKVIYSVIDFLTFGLVGAATETIGNAVKGFFGLGEEKTEEKVEGQQDSTQTSPQGAKQDNPLQKTGNFIKGVAGGVKSFFGGMFGGGGNDETPQLKEGGVVSPNGVKVEPLDSLSKISGVGGYIGKTIKMFMNLLTMPFKLVGAAMIALVVNTVGKIPGVGPFIKPILQNIISKFDLPSSIASMVMGKSPEKQKEKPKKKPEEKKKTDAGAGAAPSTPSAPAAAPAGPGGGVSGGPTNTANDTITKAGGMREDGTLKGIKGTETVIGNVRGGGTTKEYSPGAGLQPVENGNRKYWYNNSGDVFGWQKPGDPLTDLTSAGDKSMISSTVLGGPLVRNPADGKVKILQGMLGGDQTPVGYFNYDMGAILKNKGNSGQGRSQTGATKDVWEKPKDSKYGPTITPVASTPPAKSKGGWISGPQSGYPVSLNGGLSTSFIGHGTEWVGFKKASGGSVPSAFVVPFDTPATKSNGGLVGRRMSEAKTGGYALPYASGGVVKTDGIWDTGPGYTVKGTSDQKGRPVVFSQSAADAFNQMMSASGGKIRGSDVASSKRSPAKNKQVGGATNSKHMHGVAMDIHGSSGSWIRANGSKYGWVANDYPGSHGGHFEFKGAGMSPSDSKNQGKQDGTKPDTAGSSNTTGGSTTPTGSGFMGAGATENQLKDLMANLGVSSSGNMLSDVQSQNIVSQSYAGAGTPGGVKVIGGDTKDISSSMETIQSASLGNTLPPDGKWTRYSFNL